MTIKYSAPAPLRANAHGLAPVKRPSDTATFEEYLNYYLERRNWSQSRLAACARISQPQINKIINGRINNTRCCTSHYIKLKEIHALVLMDIRSKAKLIMENERQAREEFLKRKEKLSATQMATDRKKLKQKQTRLAELDRLIQATYEDKVLQRIPEEICVNLLTKYQEEKTELLPEIAELERKLFDCQRDEADVDEFIRRIKQYIDVQEITREMCLELIECITIDECPGRYVKAPREIHIYYKLIDKNAAEQFQRSKQNNV